MPQLDPSSYASQLFWLTVCFLVLYVSLARMLLPRVQSVLAKRADTIGGNLEQAKQMKADAELAREHYEKALSHARSRSHALLVEAEADIAERARKRHADLDSEIEKKLSASQASISQATQEVQGKLASVASEIAAVITQAVVQHTPDTAKVSEAVDSFTKK